MMPVVVDHRDAVGAAVHLEAAIDAAEVRQRVANVDSSRNVEPDAHRDGGRRVADVVRAGNVQLELAQILSAIAT